MNDDATIIPDPPVPPAPEGDGATPVAPPPRRGRAWSVIALVMALAGAGLAIVLVHEYLTVVGGGLAGGLFCGGGGRFDCNQVAASPEAALFGVPNALIGLLFYVVMTGLALATLTFAPAEAAAAASLAFVLALASLVFDAYLGYVMVARVGAVCLNCVATYAVNLVLAIAFGRLGRLRDAKPDTASLFLSLRPVAAKLAVWLVVVGGFGASIYVTSQSMGYLKLFAREETEQFLEEMQGAPEIDMARFEGLPSRGPEDAPITIVVAGDFQCNYCRALSEHVESLRAESPDRIRVVFVNAPVSSECNPEMKENSHEDACWLAEVSVCAADQGKFWEYHDALYHTLPYPQVTRAVVSRRLGAIGLDPGRVAACLEDGSSAAEVARQVALARELKLTAVPSIVINGHARRAGVYPAMLRAVVHTLLRSL